MAGKGFNQDFNLDALIHSAMEEVQSHYRSDNLHTRK